MSSAPFDQENSKNIWSKLKSSTNSLQSQLNNLSVNHDDYNSHSGGTRNSIKSKLNLRSGDSSKSPKLHYFAEHDGDLLTSTVVHKSLIKYYKNLKKDHPESFEGYPNWLGYEDKEEEEDLAAKAAKVDASNKSNRETLNSSDENGGGNSQSNENKIYRPDSTTSENLRSGYKPLSGRSMQRTSFNRHTHSGSESSNGGEDMAKSSPQKAKPSLKASSSMRDRLKRR